MPTEDLMFLDEESRLDWAVLESDGFCDSTRNSDVSRTKSESNKVDNFRCHICGRGSKTGTSNANLG